MNATEIYGMPVINLRDPEMDAYLASFDERHANDAEIVAANAAKASADRWEAQLTEIREKGARDAARRLANTTPLERAYRQYISDGLADTDGYFAPLSFGEWKRANTTEIPATPAWDTMPTTLGQRIRGRGGKAIAAAKRITDRD